MTKTRRTIRKRPTFTACPAPGTLASYGVRVVRVVGEARSERCLIESASPDGGTFRSAVKWHSLEPLAPGLF